MSTVQTQREINQLDNEIVALEKKRAHLEKKEADRSLRINTIRRSITKNSSLTTLNAKNRQIQEYQDEVSRISKDRADITKRIAEKRKSRADKAVKLQREEVADRKKRDYSQKSIQQGYENRIEELTAQINKQLGTPLDQSIPISGSYIETDNEEYDVFISHAWEDKVDFVDDFVTELNQLDIKVWYDKQRIVWGDSMRARIDDGLKKSKFGVAVISPNYIAEGKYWTKAELDGLFQLESINGKYILPIWHNITKKGVMEYSPIIAGKLAMTTASMTPKEIAYELVKLLRKETEEE